MSMTPSDRQISSQLELWFRENARELPWRSHRTPYSTLVSEAMLQQTQVSRVVDHYEAFMRRFPTIKALARADEQEVLTQWQGLGYYRRARHLHAASRMIVQEYGGTVPDSVESLMKLPGVGRYSAGAIASQAYGYGAPIVDGNVARVLIRMDGRDRDPDLKTTVTWLWTRAKELVESAQEPGVFNEALMELGAMICKPATPRCEGCPLADWCVAREEGKTDRLPRPRKRPERLLLHHHAIVVRRGEKFFFECRESGGLWARMWQMPTIEARRRLGPSELIRKLPLPVVDIKKRESFEHNTTHRRIIFHVYEARTRARKGLWRTGDDLDDLPMSNAHRRALKVITG